MTRDPASEAWRPNEADLYHGGKRPVAAQARRAAFIEAAEMAEAEADAITKALWIGATSEDLRAIPAKRLRSLAARLRAQS